MPSCPYYAGVRTLESIANAYDPNPQPAAPAGPKALGDLPDELLLQICDNLDSTSLLSFGLSAKAPLRLALDPSLNFRGAVLGRTFKTASKNGGGKVENVTETEERRAAVKEGLREYLASVGTPRGLASIAQMAKDALQELKTNQERAEDSNAQDFYFNLFAPAVRETLLHASPLYKFVFEKTLASGAYPQITAFDLAAHRRRPGAADRLISIAITCNLPVVALETRLAASCLDLDLRQLKSHFQSYEQMRQRATNAHRQSNLVRQIQSAAHGLSRDQKQARLSGPVKQAIFADLSKAPSRYMLFSDSRGRFDRNSEQSGVSIEAQLEERLFVLLNLMSDDDAKVLALQGMPPNAGRFCVDLQQGLWGMRLTYGVYHRWLKLSNWPGR